MAERGRGRPSDYTPAIAEEICARIMDSDYGLEHVCEADDMPSPRAVYRWLAAHEDFRQKYAQAREVQGHVQAERGLRDALKATDAALGRLAYDARKWTASKLAAKHYGDKVTQEHTGPDGGPVKHDVIERRIVDSPRD